MNSFYFVDYEYNVITSCTTTGFSWSTDLFSRESVY